MKKLFYVLISILMLSFGACNSSTGSDSQSDSLTKLNDSLAKVHPSLLDDDPWNDTTEYTPETFKQWCDTLIGNFSGKGVDTLICEPIGLNAIRKNFKISSKNGNIPPLYIEDICSITMIPEGDLDGNGTEEFGFSWELEIGNWTTYHIFTLKDNLWYKLDSNINHFRGHIEEGATHGNIAKTTNKKGEIEVLESHGGEDFYIEHKSVKLKFIPITKGIVHFAEIVE